MVSLECAEKTEMCSLMTAGFSRYPQPPFALKRPSYTSINCPGVWKLSATGERRNRVSE